ncbi:Diguanylate cyclase [Pseudomonas sp. 8Z]|uniref:GGDEF domain-containing protein n=1 Tax=Pseudomonas sp. 8Z TaxID=2653166 RepID=UPI0012F420BA|nr:diguanylate cyclase [Pseudomonas sp. 8Z]VXC61757.1 Diguanylate cyclase [Pseudomonas sp. 8Z]
MSTYHAWLKDVLPNRYAEQLDQGFRRLSFCGALESEYRAYLIEDRFEIKRIALIVAVLIWSAFAVLDVLLMGAPQLGWILAIRLVVLALVLVFGRLILQRLYPRLLQTLSMACIVAIGLGAALIVAVAHVHDPSYPYEGLLLISIAAYFLIGLRLSEAIICSLIILLVYIALECWAGLPLSRLVNNVMFLLFGNLLGAVGCYLLEYKSREHFLVSNLMRLLADRDSLTGLHNRRSFNRQLERLWRQAQGHDESLALLLCDADHFKLYNDRYGHQAGDLALQQIARLLERVAQRPLDCAVRLGGEEFAVLLFDTPLEQARQVAESIREAMVALALPHEATATAVLTLSLGVAVMQPREGDEFSQLYIQADRALYEAKAGGRNRVGG